MRCHCQAAGDYRCWDLAPARWKALTPSGLPLPFSHGHSHSHSHTLSHTCILQECMHVLRCKRARTVLHGAHTKARKAAEDVLRWI